MHAIGQLPLAPSLWRTCRVLANKQRLEILVYVMHHESRCVSDVADALGLSESMTSQYLRQLNARGILAASRSGRYVYYSVKPNPDIFESVQLVAALRHAIIRDKTSVDQIFAQVTGFTHSRRIQILQCLAKHKKTLEEIIQETGISCEALHRHLKKLISRGYVLFDQKSGRYQRGNPTNGLSKSLQTLALRYPLDATKANRKRQNQ